MKYDVYLVKPIAHVRVEAINMAEAYEKAQVEMGIDLLAMGNIPLIDEHDWYSLQAIDVEEED